MVSFTPASRYHPQYQSRSSMYIRGRITRNFAELAEAEPIDVKLASVSDHAQLVAKVTTLLQTENLNSD